MVPRWIGFHVLILLLLAVDLLVFRRQEMKWKTALAWSLGWIAAALLFNMYIVWHDGLQKGIEFFTAFLIEKSLSIDNLFVFLLIFTFFKVPTHLQRRVLYLGILEAFVLRLVLIAAGVSLIGAFHWLTYLLGIVVGLTGMKLIFQKKGELSLKESRLLQFIRRYFAVTEEYVGGKLIVRQKKRYYLTPLLLALVMVECSDVLFALDSIPAVLAITHDTFIAYTSNVFAVLGLRALYFLIAPWFDLLSHLKMGLGAVLLFIGLRMVVAPVWDIPTPISLAVTATILMISIIYSLLRRPK